MFCDRIGTDFRADVIVRSPVCEPIAHVNGGSQKEAPRYPAVEPIDTLVRRANESSNDVTLSSQKEEKGQLADGDKACTVADIFERPLITDVELVETHDEKNDYVCAYKGGLSKSWRRYSERLDGQDWQ